MTGLVCCVSICSLAVPSSVPAARGGPSRWHTQRGTNGRPDAVIGPARQARQAIWRPSEYRSIQAGWCRLWVSSRLTDDHLERREVRAGIPAPGTGGSVRR